MTTAIASPRRRRPPRFLVTTRVAKTQCRHCKATILVGDAEGLCARVDTQPIAPAAEQPTLAELRWTYTLTASGELVHRDPHRIAGGSLTGPIHAEHRCAVAIVRKGG